MGDQTHNERETLYVVRYPELESSSGNLGFRYLRRARFRHSRGNFGCLLETRRWGATLSRTCHWGSERKKGPVSALKILQDLGAGRKVRERKGAIPVNGVEAFIGMAGAPAGSRGECIKAPEDTGFTLGEEMVAAFWLLPATGVKDSTAVNLEGKGTKELATLLPLRMGKYGKKTAKNFF